MYHILQSCYGIASYTWLIWHIINSAVCYLQVTTVARCQWGFKGPSLILRAQRPTRGVAQSALRRAPSTSTPGRTTRASTPIAWPTTSSWTGWRPPTKRRLGCCQPRGSSPTSTWRCLLPRRTLWSSGISWATGFISTFASSAGPGACFWVCLLSILWTWRWNSAEDKMCEYAVQQTILQGSINKERTSFINNVWLENNLWTRLAYNSTCQ